MAGLEAERMEREAEMNRERAQWEAEQKERIYLLDIFFEKKTCITN